MEPILLLRNEILLGNNLGTRKLSPINITYEMKSKPILDSREHQPFHGNG